MGLPAIIGIQAGLWLISYLLREEPDEEKPQEEVRKGSTSVAQEGQSPPMVFGTARVRKTNVLMYKGSGSFQDYLREAYYELNDIRQYAVDLQLGVCVRPLSNTTVAFRRFWAGDTLISDGINNNATKTIYAQDIWGGKGRGGGVGVVQSGGNYGGRLSTRDGRATITEAPFGNEIVDAGPNRGPGPTFVPGAGGLASDDHYGGQPGLCTLFLEIFQIGERSSMPGFSVEMTVWPNYTGTILSTVGGESNGDANPVAALYQILTDDLVGIGLPSSVVDVTSFNAAAVVLDSEGNGLSIATDKAVTAKQMIKTIIKQIDGVLYMDPQTQELRIKLVREDYGAFPYAGLEIYDDDDVVEVVDYKETSWEDSFNQVRIKFQDRDAEYSDRFAVSQDHASASQSGRIKSIDIDFPGVKTAELANAIASRELKFHSTPQLLVTIKVNRRANELRPGDVIKWTNTEYQITDMVLRIHQISFGTLEEGTMVLTCSRDKYSNVVSVFADPDRHWLDDYGVKPKTPDCWVVQELPPNPFFDRGSNWQAPAFGTVATLVGLKYPESPVAGTATSGTGLSIVVDTQVADGGYGSSGGSKDSAPCGKVGVAYAKSNGPYFDSSGTGLVISPGDSSVLRNSTPAEVRAGRSVILIGEEYIAYENFTDLGGGSYRLTNVWRGLFDTVAEDHPVGTSLFFMSDVNMGRVIQQKKFVCDQTIAIRMLPSLVGRRQSSSSDYFFSELLFTRRDQQASRATGFTLYDEGFDAVGSHRDVEYGFDTDDEKAILISPFTGDDAISSATDLGQVFTNDLRGDWRRRPRPTECAQAIVRGDDADAPFLAGDNTRLQLEGKRDVDTDWTVLHAQSFDGDSVVDGPGDFLSVGRLLPGPGKVRLSSYRSVSDTGKELASRHAEEILVDMIGCRQLLLNRKFRPYWDVDDPRGAGGFGKGYKIVGNGDHAARGWRSIGDIEPTFGVGDVPVAFGAGAILEQGDDTEGHSFYSQENAVGQWVEIEQIIPVSYLDTTGSELWLSWYYYREATSTDKYRVTIETRNAAGTVLDTNSTGEISGAGPRGWRRVEQTLAGLSADVAAVRVTIGLSNNQVADPNRASNMTLLIGRDISGQLLLDEDFNDITTNWTQTGVWTNPGVAGALNVLDVTRNYLLLAPVGGLPAVIEQDVSLPAAFNAGDWIRLEFWTACTGAPDLIIGKVEARDIANAVITTTVGSYVHSRTNQWYVHELWLQVPPLCDDINVEFEAKELAGGASLDVAVAESNLRCLKADAASTTLDYSAPVTHVAPLTQQAFAEATQTPGVRPSHIFPMQDGNGVAPVDVLQGVVLDEAVGTVDVDYTLGAPAIGLHNGTDPVSELALELSKTGGGVKSTNLDFLNPNNDAFGIYLQFRLTGSDHSGTANIISKINAQPTPVDGSGFQIYYDASTQQIVFNVETNHVGGSPVSVSVNTTGIPEDGAWHWVYCKFDVTAELLSIFSDYSAGTTSSLTTFLAEEMSNTVDEVYLGFNDVLGGTFDDGFDSPFQIRYMATFKGVQAERFTRPAGQNMWKHATDPNAEAGYGLAYTRAQETLVPLSDSTVATYAGTDSGLATPQVPLGYFSGLTDTNKLALPSISAIRNRIPRSEDMSDASWTKTNATVTPKSQVSPRGVREMQIVTQTGLGGHAAVTLTGLTAVTTYTFSTYAKIVGGAHSTLVEVTQNDLSTVLAGTTMATTATNKRFKFSFTTLPGQSQLELRLYGGLITDSAFTTGYFGAMIQQGTQLYPIVLNPGASLSLSSSTVQKIVAMTANSLVNAEEGAIETTFSAASTASVLTRYVYDIRANGSSADRRAFKVSSSGARDLNLYDGSAVLQINMVDHPALVGGTEVKHIQRWRAKANLASGAYTVSDDDGTTLRTSVTTMTPGVGIEDLHMGHNFADGNYLDGGIQRMKFWRGEPRDLSF
jgi:hypothetical protein